MTLDAWETVPPGNESALMQVCSSLFVLPYSRLAETVLTPLRPSCRHLVSLCCGFTADGFDTQHLLPDVLPTPCCAQAVARHPVGVGMCVGPYIKAWRACV